MADITTKMWRNYLVVTGSIIGLITVARLVTAGNATVDAVCGLVEVLLIVAHLVALQVGIRRNKPEHRWPWHVLTATPVLVLAAVVADTFNREITDKNVYPALADYLFLLALLPVVVFFVAANHYQSARSDRNGLLDASMIATAAALLAWAFIVSPHVHSTKLGVDAKCTLFSLPIIDVTCVWLIARVALGRGKRTPVFWSAFAANLILIASDSAFTWFTLNERVTPFNYGLSSTGWDVTYALFFGCALHPQMVSFISPVDNKKAPSLSRPRLMMISIAALIAPVVALISGGANVGVLASMVMFMLVVARMDGMLRRQESTSSVLGDTLAKLQATDIQLRHAQKQQAIGKLAAGIAHEVDAPVHTADENLRHLQHSFEVLTDATERYRQALTIRDEDARRRRLKDIDDSLDVEMIRDIPTVIENSLQQTDHVTKLLESIKSFGAAASSDRQIMDLDKAIADVLAITESQTRDFAMVETSFGAVHHLDASPADINEVLINLMTNAAHAVQDKFTGSDEAGHITIRTELDGDEAVITVSDNGVGIRKDIQSRIFDPFFTTKGAGRGSGQGLAIVWNLIVDRHHGSVVIDSKEGVGTTVVVRLPAGGKRRFERVTPRDEQLDSYLERSDRQTFEARN